MEIGMGRQREKRIGNIWLENDRIIMMKRNYKRNRPKMNKTSAGFRRCFIVAWHFCFYIEAFSRKVKFGKFIEFWKKYSILGTKSLEIVPHLFAMPLSSISTSSFAVVYSFSVVLSSVLSLLFWSHMIAFNCNSLRAAWLCAISITSNSRPTVRTRALHLYLRISAQRQ